MGIVWFKKNIRVKFVILPKLCLFFDDCKHEKLSYDLFWKTIFSPSISNKKYTPRIFIVQIQKKSCNTVGFVQADRSWNSIFPLKIIKFCVFRQMRWFSPFCPLRRTHSNLFYNWSKKINAADTMNQRSRSNNLLLNITINTRQFPKYLNS